MTTTRSVRIKTVALPIEHGAWGFWFEPALLGLLLAPSAAGVALALAALAALLLQTPLSIALTDLRRGRRYPRTALAWRFAAGYGAALAACAATAWWLAPDAWFLLPVALAAPLALVQLWFDAHQRAREHLPETCGALAMGSLVAAIALVAGMGLGPALLLWLLLALRAAPAIAYVRARLRLERAQPAEVAPVVWAHLAAATVALAVGTFTAFGPLLAVPYGLLALRAALGVSRWRRPVSAKVIGFRELGYGVLTVVLVAAALAT